MLPVVDVSVGVRHEVDGDDVHGEDCKISLTKKRDCRRWLAVRQEQTAFTVTFIIYCTVRYYCYTVRACAKRKYDANFLSNIPVPVPTQKTKNSS
jgi:hypothetical protein